MLLYFQIFSSATCSLIFSGYILSLRLTEEVSQTQKPCASKGVPLLNIAPYHEEVLEE
jgi:hypothetical protein